MSEKKGNKNLWIAGGIILVLVLIIARTGLSDTSSTTSTQSSNNISTITTPTQNNTQSNISSKNASAYINEIVTICGPIVDSRFSSASNGQPTFLNFDYPYPNHTFTIVIWGQNRTNFSSPPEKMYMSQNVCIDGYVDTYKGKPQIEATSEIMISIR